MNARIYELMDGFNEKPSRTTGRSRRDIFEEEEQPTLGKLLMTPYRFRYRKEVKQSGTYHVMVDKHNYKQLYGESCTQQAGWVVPEDDNQSRNV